jgi:hypothetical protein
MKCKRCGCNTQPRIDLASYRVTRDATGKPNGAVVPNYCEFCGAELGLDKFGKDQWATLCNATGFEPKE